MPNIVHLERFVAVAEELNFRKAAARLHITQPRVSDSIRQLEEELGTRLLQRTRQSVELTEAGLVYLGRARLILSQLSEAADVTRAVAHGMRGHIVVGFNPASSYEILPRILRQFRHRFPDVSLGFEELTTVERESALLQKRIDVALFLAPTVTRQGIHQEVFMREPLIAALPRDHPLARGPEIDLRQLRNETFILLHSRQETGNRARVLYACQQAGFIPNEVRQIDRIHNAISLIASGLGVALCPASFSRFMPPGAVYVPLRDPASQFYVECGISYRSGDDSALTAGFVEVARDVGRPTMRARETGPPN